MPLGPRVDFTRSPRARAPTNDERRAFSAFSSVACNLNYGFEIEKNSVITIPVH